MPYFIYRISPHRLLDYVDEFEAYKPARDAVRLMRQQQDKEDLDTLKIIFAKDRYDAENLLKIQRERQPSDDD